MKRLSAIIIALTMAASLASCAKDAGTDEAEDIKATVTNRIEDLSSIVIKSDPDSLPDGKDSGRDIDGRLTPATTMKDDFLKSEASNYVITGKSQRYNSETRERLYYEGGIRDEKLTKNIFELLCSIIKKNEITLKGDQVVTGGGSEIIAFETMGSGKFSLCEGILSERPEEDGGSSVYIFKTPDRNYYYLNPDFSDREELEVMICKGLQTEKNLVRKVTFDRPDSKQDPDTRTDMIAFVQVRSNCAWGFQLGGTYIDKSGNVYKFDFSDRQEIKGSYTNWILDLICAHIDLTDPVMTVDKDKINEAYSYAELVAPDAETTEKHMMCDYGQNTIYAVVNGELVKLESRGDVDVTVNDDNAQAALRILESIE